MIEFLKKKGLICKLSALLGCVCIVWNLMYIGYANLFIFPVMCLCCMALWHISQFEPSSSLSWKQLFVQYMMWVILPKLLSLVVNSFRKQTKYLVDQQIEMLLGILERNKNTQYVKDHNLQGVTSVDYFRINHPLTNYKDYKDYIDRCYKGEENILFPDEVGFFSSSAGTTNIGKNKIFPLSQFYIENYLSKSGPILIHLLGKYSGGNLKRFTGLHYKPDIRTSPCGVNIGPVSSIFKRSNLNFNLSPSPDEVLDLEDEHAAMYSHAVFAVAEKEITRFDGIFSTNVYSFFDMIETHWQTICDNIEKGTFAPPEELSSKFPSCVPYILSQKISPNPQRASEVRSEFKKGINNIATRIWPQLRIFNCINTGSFATQSKLLREKYAQDVKQMGYYHTSSESPLGYGVKSGPNEQCYALAYNVMFAEFICEDDIDLEQPDTLLAHQLKEGKCYELVITNFNGLYRYRVGDVIKVVDFIKRLPVYTFQYRVGSILNVHSERVSEDIVASALNEAVMELGSGVNLVDYTVCENSYYQDASGTEANSRFYVALLELHFSAGNNHTLKQPYLNMHQLKIFDEKLQQKSTNYKKLRSRGSIHDMKVVQVKRGGFQKLKELLTKDKPNQQFKMPRVMRHTQGIKVLLENRLGILKTVPKTRIGKWQDW